MRETNPWATECTGYHWHVGSLLSDLARHAEDIRAHAARFGLDDVRVSGSVARGQEVSTSDIDLIVRADHAEPLDLAEFAGYVAALSGRDVDLFVLPRQLSGGNETARALLADAVEIGSEPHPPTPATRQGRSRVEKVLAITDDIASVVAKGRRDFIDDRMLRDAVTLSLRDLSRAARDPALREQFPAIRWNAWAHILSAAGHSREMLWQVASENVPNLAEQLRPE